MKTILTAVFTLYSVSFLYSQNDIKTATDTSDPAAVVKEFLYAYINGDHERFASYLHPDVIWVQPGNNRISGVKKSKDELLSMGARMSELSAGTIKLVDVEFYTSYGNTVACVLHWKAAQPIGSVLDVKNIDIYTVENSKIVLVKVFSSDLPAEDKFWGR